MAVAPPGSPPSAARQSTRLPAPAFAGEPSFVLPRSWACDGTVGDCNVDEDEHMGTDGGASEALRRLLSRRFERNNEQQIWMGILDFNRSWDSACGARRPCGVNPFSWLLSYWLIRSGGIKVQSPNTSTDIVLIVAVIILIGLFSMQRYGTDRVGWPFAPIVLIWFILIGSVGALNIHKYGSSVLKAYNPVYIYRYFQRRGNSADSWTVLGGIMLSITGIEALYADLCHFPVLSIQIAFTFIVFLCIRLAYTGQAAYIISKQHMNDAFYKSIPGPPRLL